MSDSTDAPPQPPTKFRCNRTRMILSIRVTLHHVAAAQINLTTTTTHIKLDTLKSRRKFAMDRVYPRGVECDDSRTTAKMEGGVLVIEMPITKLPPIGDPPPNPAPVAQAAPAVKKRKHAAAEEPVHKRTRDLGGAAPAVSETSEAASELAPALPRKKVKKSGADGGGKGSAAPSEQRMHELLDDATQTAERRREESLGKMRRFEEAEAEQKRKAAERQAEREHEKAKLLEAFKRQQEQARDAKKADKQNEHKELAKHKAFQKAKGQKGRSAGPAAADVSTPIAAKAPAKKRVSFSNEAVEAGRSRGSR